MGLGFPLFYRKYPGTAPGAGGRAGGACEDRKLALPFCAGLWYNHPNMCRRCRDRRVTQVTVDTPTGQAEATGLGVLFFSGTGVGKGT